MNEIHAESIVSDLFVSPNSRYLFLALEWKRWVHQSAGTVLLKNRSTIRYIMERTKSNSLVLDRLGEICQRLIDDLSDPIAKGYQSSCEKLQPIKYILHIHSLHDRVYKN